MHRTYMLNGICTRVVARATSQYNIRASCAHNLRIWNKCLRAFKLYYKWNYVLYGYNFGCKVCEWVWRLSPNVHVAMPCQPARWMRTSQSNIRVREITTCVSEINACIYFYCYCKCKIRAKHYFRSKVCDFCFAQLTLYWTARTYSMGRWMRVVSHK